MSSYLQSTLRLARYYKHLGDETINRLSDEELRWSPGPDDNSVAVIVKHLWGNMLSRWTNFLTEDGEKPWRQRDAEFENDILGREELLSKWNEGWKTFTGALEALDDDDLQKTVYIRNEGHSVIDAIQRQMAHYPYHIGQIVYLGRLIKGSDWKSLSVPKNASQAYNERKFSQEKKDQHFTDNV